MRTCLSCGIAVHNDKRSHCPECNTQLPQAAAAPVAEVLAAKPGRSRSIFALVAVCGILFVAASVLYLRQSSWSAAGISEFTSGCMSLGNTRTQCDCLVGFAQSRYAEKDYREMVARAVTGDAISALVVTSLGKQSGCFPNQK